MLSPNMAASRDRRGMETMDQASAGRSGGPRAGARAVRVEAACLAEWRRVRRRDQRIAATILVALIAGWGASAAGAVQLVQLLGGVLALGGALRARWRLAPGGTARSSKVPLPPHRRRRARVPSSRRRRGAASRRR